MLVLDIDVIILCYHSFLMFFLCACDAGLQTLIQGLGLVQGVTLLILQLRKRRTVKSPFQIMSPATKLRAENHLTSKTICSKLMCINWLPWEILCGA